uniref:Cytochrome c oxidase subunit 2 n=1 Tax=Neelides sp. FZ-2019 TaxID=2583951 RepID=A0A6H0EVQ5_9HEXA|nr:cytochrome c oxidase subunit 2 [Neelides sp. FZ-2019]
MPSPNALSFQDAASPIMEQLIFFHDHAMMIVIIILTLVSINLIDTYIYPSLDFHLLESHELELFWTLTPSIILIFIGLPSIRLLYLMDETFNPSITLKTIGHQWYWSYEYSDFKSIEFDSYMTPQEESNSTSRLIFVDNATPIPINSMVRNLISSADVLHSWAIPSFGVKADATPGRINQTSFLTNYPGQFFGQCSEICGANHSFMPIMIEAISLKSFIKWIKNY